MTVFSELYEFNEKLLMNLKFQRAPINKVAEGFKFVPEILSGKKFFDGKDAESQIDYLNARKATLAKCRDDSFSDYKRYSSLYVKIFFMVGVLMAVLLA